VDSSSAIHLFIALSIFSIRGFFLVIIYLFFNNL
jgi:hypothetical protein